MVKKLLLMFFVVACGTETIVRIESKHTEKTSCQSLPERDRAECERNKHDERMEGITLAREIIARQNGNENGNH